MRKPEGGLRSYQEMVDEGLETRYKGTYSTAALCSNIEPETMQFKPFPPTCTGSS